MKPVRQFALVGLVSAIFLPFVSSVALAGDPFVVAGETLFNQHCQTCHNPDAADLWPSDWNS